MLDLRSSSDKGEDLARKLGEFGRSLAEDLGPRFELIVKGPASPVNATASHDIYGIGREALFNAYRHAAAGHVSLEIMHGHNDFRMVIEDDGLGIPEDVLRNAERKGHWAWPACMSVPGPWAAASNCGGAGPKARKSSCRCRPVACMPMRMNAGPGCACMRCSGDWLGARPRNQDRAGESAPAPEHIRSDRAGDSGIPARSGPSPRPARESVPQS
ncbi:MAG TPA: hypothetical protein VF774_21065 [Pseudoduganella sp.]